MAVDKKYKFNEEGLTALIMDLRKDDAVVVKWNIHSVYSSVDEDYPSGQSYKTAYSLVLPNHIHVVEETCRGTEILNLPGNVLVVEEDTWGGTERLQMTYRHLEGFVPSLKKSDNMYETLENALSAIVTEEHTISISGKRSMERWSHESGYMMREMDDNVHYLIDGKEVLHEVKPPYTEEFFNGEHVVSTCLNGQFADVCCENPLGILSVASALALPFTNANALENAVQDAVQ